MAEQNQLHIQFVDIDGENFDKKRGWLNLKKSRTITITIKEYQEDIQNLEKEINKKRELIKKKYTEKSEQLYKDISQYQENINKCNANLQEDIISKNKYDKQLDEFQNKLSICLANANEIILEKNKTLTELLEREKEEKQAVSDKYKNVLWVSQVVHNGLSNLNPSSHYNRIEKGSIIRKHHIGEFLEGGGFIYTEPFFEGTQPQGKAPYGAFISAQGTTHDIVSVQWMTPENEIITSDKIIAFGSTVYLNIYTEGLFGQHIKVCLKDRDYVIDYLTLGFWNGNDDLNIYQRKSKEKTGGSEPEVMEESKYMIRNVDAYRVNNQSIPEKAKIGVLGIKKLDPESLEELVTHVQKSYFKVFIDPKWEDEGGDELEIFAVIEHELLSAKDKRKEMKQKKNYILNVSKNGKLYEESNNTGNQVTSLSGIESNIAHFEQCRYKAITALYGIDSMQMRVLFQQGKVNVDKKDLIYEVVADDTTKRLFLFLDDEKTADCNHENTPQDHTGNVIKVVGTRPFNLMLKDDQASFDISFPIPTLKEAVDMAFMTERKRLKYLKNYNLKFDTCRFQHNLNIRVYPELEYELGFKLKSENPFYTGQNNVYTQRKYLGEKGLFKIRQNKINQREQNYKNNKQEVKEGRLNFNFYEIAAEYSFGGIKQAEISIDKEHPFFNVLDTIMWVANMVGNLTFNKEAEEAEKELNKNKETSRQLNNRKKNHNKYLENVGKSLNKLPLKIDIEGPVFAGAVAWKYDPSTRYKYQVGTSYAVKFKAAPLLGVTGRLDLLFVATKIPYVGVAVKGITGVVDAVGSVDNIWNWFVDKLRGGDKYKIKLDIDYFIDLYCSGKFNVEATAVEYHTIDGFRNNDIKCQAEIEFGIECGGSIEWKIGKIVGEAEFTGAAFAKFTIERDEKDEVIRCKYDGLYAKVSAKINTDVETRKGQGSDSEEDPPKKFLIHGGFTYETKLT
ncbi:MULTISPECIES: hypothetical protein [unclassified Apibacter]|uniref:hypothetical protein n=1 Tax=unclassified Apibacter TaxID=2630820 RepID=UPI001325EC80|nr:MULTISPECIES: hypothetical protein [unclassified Apibacter]MCX8677601.1 hypothetical protein [Apibacter sp. B3919]MXO25233.1 hypothetical protein [Apibacter sp. B3924]MXO26984.1 hypothetical protein [Apibacter sp. B3813]MXO28888.1 hypothetical protein [Apibacter sp. B3913]MXO30839.1 hypothetical protein [Apibacter sp. B3912]